MATIRTAIKLRHAQQHSHAKGLVESGQTRGHVRGEAACAQTIQGSSMPKSPSKRICAGEAMTGSTWITSGNGAPLPHTIDREPECSHLCMRELQAL